jgi:septal ring factor EnvC (AmiA/AmiB activator)
MRIARLLFGCFLVLCAALPARAQNSEDRGTAEQRLRRLEAQIAKDEELLSKTEEAEEVSQQQLDLLNRQISMREELVLNYQRHLELMNFEQDSLRTSMQSLQADLDELKTEYHARASHAYMFGRMHDLALILAAESINQMLIRIRYLHRFAAQRRQHLFHIQESNDVIQQRQDELVESLERSNQLLTTAEEEQKVLRLQKDQQRRLVSQLRNQRNNLEENLESNRTIAGQLAGRVRELITSEPGRPRSGSAPKNSVSGSFQANQGRLPWPAEGVIIEPYGENVHPVHGTVTPNPGILIATEPQAEVRTVFQGRVSSIDVMPDFGTVMIVEHGDYHTVYSNFSVTWVSEGDDVEAGQVLGFAGTEAEPKGSALFFGLFRDGEELDPTPWLKPRF